MRRLFKFGLALACVFALSLEVTPAKEARFQIGSINLDSDVSEFTDAKTYAFRIYSEFPSLGWLGFGGNVERVEIDGVSLGAYCLDGLIRAQGCKGLFCGTVDLGGGVIIGDAATGTASVGEESVPLRSQDNSVRYLAEIGGQIWLTPGHRVGLGVSYQWSRAASRNTVVEDSDGALVYLTVPLGRPGT